MAQLRILCCKQARYHVVFDFSSTVDARDNILLLPLSPTRSVARIGVAPIEHACSLDPGPRLEMAMTAVRWLRGL